MFAGARTPPTAAADLGRAPNAKLETGSISAARLASASGVSMGRSPGSDTATAGPSAHTLPSPTGSSSIWHGAGRRDGAHAPPLVEGVGGLVHLGSGGCATVWAGQRIPSGELVAVKVPQVTLRAPELLERLAEEGRLLSRLRRHPNVVRVFGMSQAVLADGTSVPAIVMELVPQARSLLDYCDQHGLDLRARLRLFRAACAGVAHLHRAGVLHLDLKPSNILVDDQGVPRIADLGAALTLLDGDPRRSFFTPQYASPEQLRLPGKASALEQTSDVYSLGKILAALLGGPDAVALPGGQLTLEERARHALSWSARSTLLRLHDPDEGLCEVLLRATDPDPQRRYHDARELVGAIDDLLQPWPLRAARHAGGVIAALPRGARRFGARCAGVALSAGLAVAASFLIVLAIHRAAALLPAALSSPSSAMQQNGGVVPAVVDEVPPPTAFSNVCVVEIRPDSDLAALGQRCGGVLLDPQRMWTLRFLQAALVDRLAELGAAAVALDVKFPATPGAEAATAALVEAIERARDEHDCPVVAGTERLTIDPGPELLEPRLRSVLAGWGSIEGFDIPGVGRSHPMVAETPEGATAGGLAIAAVRAAARAETATLESDGVFLRGGSPSRRLLAPRTVLPMPKLSAVLAQSPSLASADVAVHSANLPARALLESITIDAQELLGPDPSPELAALVRGRIVIVSNNLHRLDEHPTRSIEGRPVFMAWWHACAAETMLNPTTAGPREVLVLLAMAACAGVGFAVAAPLSVGVRRWARHRGLSTRERLGLAAGAAALTLVTLAATAGVLAAVRPGMSIEALSVALALLFGIVVAITSVAVAARSWGRSRSDPPGSTSWRRIRAQDPRHAQLPAR